MSVTPINSIAQGQIVTEGGLTLDVPAIEIGAEAAAIFRNYFYWCLKNQLEPELFCKDCYDGTRNTRATHNVTEQEIAIACGCKLRFFKGPWMQPAAIPVPKRSNEKSEELPTDYLLPVEAARLLRAYKKVMIDLGLLEAIRCNACFHLNLEDGCNARVGNNSILIQCRCSRRVYQGMTQ